MPDNNDNKQNTGDNTSKPDKTQDVVKGPDFIYVQNSDQKPKPQNIGDVKPTSGK